VGHTTEIKGSIMLDEAKASHFAYIGESILGRYVNIGAGTRLANLKMNTGPVTIRAGKQRYNTGRQKLGAVLGDGTETGCNSVTAPGTLIGPGSIIYAAIAIPGGYYPGKTYFRPGRNAVQSVSGALRLVVLPPEKWYSREESRLAFDAALDCMQNNGPKPRHRWNRLLFLAADYGTLSRLNDAARVALAWSSIVDDIQQDRLTIDNLQRKQAEKELQTAEEVLPRAARECYRWLICPVQETPTDHKPRVEAFAINTTGASVGREIERVCIENELVVATWSPIHLRTKLTELYWKEGQPTASAMAFWEDTLRYLYLPRLKDRDVLAKAIRSGAASRDFFATAYGQHNGTFEGFNFGSGNVQLDDTLLLIEPEAAKQYEAAKNNAEGTSPVKTGEELTLALETNETGTVEPGGTPGQGGGPTRPRSFHGTVEVAPATAKMRLVQIAEEIVSVLVSDPNASVKVVVEISAEFPDGAKDQLKRAVSENARSLGLKSADWE
jgi:hypothetical protein